MKFKLILIFIVLLLPFKSQSQQTNLPDSSTLDLQSKVEAQGSQIKKLDSTITHLKNENAHLKELAEQDIDHAKSLINTTETVVEFIAVLLAIFSVVGGFIITKMFRQSNQINKDHKVLLDDWEKTRKEIDDLKEASLKEGKELLQILFYITEGDNYLKNDIDESIRLYEQALNIRKDNPEIYAKLGHAKLTLGRYEQAIFQLEEGYKIAPDNISILNALARANRKLKQYDEAESKCKKVLEIDEGNLSALKELSRIYLINHDYKNAKDISEKLLSSEKSALKDSTFIPHSNLAIIYAYEGYIKKEHLKKEHQKKHLKNAKDHFKEALTKIDTILSQSPENKWLIISKAITLVGLSRLPNVEEGLSRLSEGESLLIDLKEQRLNDSEIGFIIERLNILLDIYKDKKIREMISIFEKSNISEK